MGTDGIALTLLGYLVPCVAADWGLSSVEEGTLSASVYGGELVSSLNPPIMLGLIALLPATLLLLQQSLLCCCSKRTILLAVVIVSRCPVGRIHCVCFIIYLLLFSK